MNKKQKIILLSVILVVLVALLSMGLTTAFMKPIEQGGNLTEIALSSCAKIKLTSTSSINLSNTYPMSRNKGFETSPYNFTVTSYCDTYVGFNLYIATLSTNTLDASNIHYILTNKGSKEAIVEGILSNATNGVSDFSDSEKTELNTGLKGTYGSIYKIHNESVALKGSKEYDLYLYVDENATNTTMGKTFSAGVAVKSYDRDKIGLEICDSGQNLKECIISYANLGSDVSKIYYHDSTLANGAGDNSYRYAGPSDSVNNYICLGSEETACPDANLFRIIGVFGDKTKVIRAKSVGEQKWHTSPDNTWSSSSLNTYLNGEYLTSLGTLADKIATTTWKVGGGSWSNIGTSVPKTAYQYEVGSSASTTTVDKKIGLMYVTDYYYSASPSAWTLVGYNPTDDLSKGYKAATSTNWIYSGTTEWTISRNAVNSYIAFYVNYDGDVNHGGVIGNYAVRPSFNLESSVTYVSGSGSMSDPIVIN